MGSRVKSDQGGALSRPSRLCDDSPVPLMAQQALVWIWTSIERRHKTPSSCDIPPGSPDPWGLPLGPPREGIKGELTARWSDHFRPAFDISFQVYCLFLGIQGAQVIRNDTDATP